MGSIVEEGLEEKLFSKLRYLYTPVCGRAGKQADGRGKQVSSEQLIRAYRNNKIFKIVILYRI